MLLELLVPVAVVAQSLVMDNYVPSDPQVWSFIKYGGQTPDLYTGTVRAEIPIYTYKDPDFEIPIALSYASNGYMPNIQANFVGLGWTLIAGGAITRRVNNIKDEGSQQIAGHTLNGYYQYSLVNLEPSIRRRTLASFAPFGYFLNNQRYETDPDLFFFRMPGHNGKFMIEETGGTAKVFDSTRPSGEYQVGLSGFGVGVLSSRIVITSGDGYQYVFGGEPDGDYTIRTQVNDEKDGTQSGEKDDYCSDSWPLTRIIAPNGRQVVYHYSINQTTIVDESCHPYASRWSESEVIEDTGWPSGSSSSSSSDYTQGRIIRTLPVARLSSIEVLDKDGQTAVFDISFTYGSRTKEKMRFAGPSIPLRELGNPGCLTSIVVRNHEDDILRQCNLSYRYTGTTANPGNPVLLLKQVQIPGEGKYAMDYYNQDNPFPFHGTSSLDHWGYWNNFTPDYNAQSLLPAVKVNDTTNVETIPPGVRAPNSQVAQSGMLKKLTYPTGGWTDYIYEAHQFQRRITKDGTEQSKGIPIVQSDSALQTAGGLRLKSITDHVSANTAVTRQYLYTDASGEDTGLLYKNPRYNMTYHLIYNYPDVNDHSLSFTKTDYPAYMLDEQIVGYSQVTEVFADGSERVVYFSDYEEIQDDTQYDTIIRYSSFHEYGDGVHQAMPNHIYQYLREAQSLSRCRGKVKEENLKDSAGKITAKTVYAYSISSARAKNISCWKQDIDSLYVFHHFVGDYPLTTETHTVYSSSGTQPVVTTTSYTYNNLGQLKKRTVTTADGAIYNDNYLYVKDLSSRTAAQDTMVARNIVAPFVYKTLSVTRPGVSGARLAGGTRQAHGLFTVAGRQLPVVTAVSDAVVSSASVYTSPLTLTWKPQLTISAVDGYGRPMEVKDANGIYTTYFWGYGGMYLAGRFVNCSLSQLAQRLHAGFNQYDAGWTGISDSNAALFRNIPGVQFTCWRYSPFVGLTEVTDPSGRKTTYTYNSHGHLTGVIGPDGNTLVEYEYSVDQ